MVVDHFFTGSLAALLGTASVATVRCPACQQAVYEDTPTCPHCGLVLGVLDRAFGVPPIIGESVCDLRRQLSKKERKELGRMVDRFGRRFPQVTVVVVLCKPPEGVPLAGYTFWIFNHSRAVSLLERGGENRQVMLTLDLEAEQVACMIGYGLEPLIPEAELREVIQAGLEPLGKRGVLAGVEAMMGRLEAVLIRVSQALPTQFGLEGEVMESLDQLEVRVRPAALYY